MIKIDKEFQSLIPPLSAEELAGLEQSLKEEGCRDALVLWGDTIIDGHNRYEICQREGIPFETVQREFSDRNEAVIWIIQNQFARRNLPAYERARLALRLKPAIAEKAKERQGTRTDLNIRENSHECEPGRTDEQLANVAGLSSNTIRRVETIEEKATPELKDQLRTGEISINQAYNAIRKQEKEKEVTEAKERIAEQTRTGENPPRIRVGDSICKTLPDTYDLMLTDPPYSTDVENVEEFAGLWLPAALLNVKRTGFAYVFIGAYPEELKAYLNVRVPAHMKLDQVLVWTYKNTLGNNPKDHYKLNWQACLFYRGVDAPPLDCPLTSEQWAVQEINAPDGRQGDRYHTWQKPMEIAERFIRHSTKPGMKVYDPFACTGTFLLAAAKLGRDAFGFEISKENAAIAVQRGCVYDP